ncbi:MAG: DUF2779 domain-containing protein [Balneolaceae bacterium]
MRKALSVLYPGGEEAGEAHSVAIERTQRWLTGEDRVKIYGGVLAYKNFHARFPILIKKGNHLTLLQIHGKIWKPGHHDRGFEKQMLENRKIGEYVREAAYKRWMIENLYPDFNLSIRLCFPNRHYKSTSENLFRDVAFINEGADVQAEEIQDLFVEVPVDRAVEIVLNGNAELPVHPAFRQMTFEQQLDWMGKFREMDREKIPFQITGACNVCAFRKTQAGAGTGDTGCWQENLEPAVRHPRQQVFDLIGHGNKQHADNGRYFQEEIPPPYGIESFEQVQKSGGNTISMDQRRALQLLSAKQTDIPQLWIKEKLLEEIRSVRYPLHFIDFEAATCAIPMTCDAKPYKPVLFQFSCHTLRSDGRVTHHQWLDQNRQKFTHEEFIRKFLAIPDIGQGTLVQYSPFEKQALNTLLKGCGNGRNPSDSLAADLKSVIDGPDNMKSARFMDMNRMVRDFYFNSELMDGLGLKNVLISILSTSSYLQNQYSKPVSVHDVEVRLVSPEKDSCSDPYRKVQENRDRIDDGSTAMHAWLYTKTPDCSQERRSRIHRLLRRYCTLDSLALVLIFQDWNHLAGRREPATEGDLILWEERA